MRDQRTNIYAVAIGAGVLQLAVLLPLLSLAPFGGSSEAREAHVTRVIVESGSWLLPLRHGLVPSKPPLFHWLAALSSMALGGVSEFSVRLISSVAGSLMLALVVGRTYSLAIKFGGPWRTEAKKIASLTAVIMATSYAYALMLSDARVDLLASLFMLAAAFSILRRFDGLMERPEGLPRLRNRDWNQFYLFAALGVLTKGPIGLALPATSVFSALAYLMGARSALKLCFKPRAAWLILAVIAFPWYFNAAGAWQAEFVGRQLIFENLKRFAGGEDINHEAFWFYVPSFLRTVFPWSLLFIAAACRSLSRLRSPPASVPGREARRRVINVYLVCFAAGFLFFSAASGKRHSYLVPILPFMAVYLGLTLSEWWQRRGPAAQARLRRAGKVLAALLIIYAAALAVAAASVSFAKPELAPAGSRLQVVLAHLAPGSLRIAALLLAALLLRAASWAGPIRRLGLFALLLAALQSTLVAGLSFKYRLKDFDVLAERIRTASGRDSLSIIRARADELFDPLMYYLHRDLSIVAPEAERFPCAAVGRADRQFVVARKKFLESLPAPVNATYRAVFEFVSSGEKLSGKKASSAIVLGECVD